jgi:hypothetical protein
MALLSGDATQGLNDQLVAKALDALRIESDRANTYPDACYGEQCLDERHDRLAVTSIRSCAWDSCATTETEHKELHHLAGLRGATWRVAPMAMVAGWLMLCRSMAGRREAWPQVSLVEAGGSIQPKKSVAAWPVKHQCDCH